MASLSSAFPSSVLSLQSKKDLFDTPSIPGGKCSQSVPKMVNDLKKKHSFVKGSRHLLLRPKAIRKSLCVSASWVANSQTAGELFTLGTVAVLPFYALMVLAPKSNLIPRNCSSFLKAACLSIGRAHVAFLFSILILKFSRFMCYLSVGKTKRTMDCNIPYVLLGALYSFLLYLSWTPDKMQLLFSSKYLLPELSSIAQMFQNDIALASAWIHLLAVDLFAARQVFHDGQKNNIETRHSITLCLFFCPIGIMTHAFTKALTKRNSEA